jgi:membrane fusion protein, heavy metal efflux system
MLKKMKNLKIFLLLLATACSKNAETEQKAENLAENAVELSDAQLKNAEISTTSIQQSTLKSILKVNGKIDVPPQNLVSISVPLGGYVKTTKLLPGMHLSKGEEIAMIEDQQYIQIQQDYLLTKSKLHYAELEYKRQSELNQSQASSEKVMLQAEAEVKNNKILLASLSEKLKLININPANLNETNISKSITIHSPINGFVSKINVNIGKYVNPSDILFELVNPTDIHLNMKVFEKDIASLSIGKKVWAYTNANPNKKYLCEIILISKDVSTDGTTDVHCHFESYDKSLIPGMYMNAEVEIISNNAYTLPDECIVNFEGKSYVFIESTAKKYDMQEVQIGQSDKQQIEIKNADELKNKKIVQRGAYTLLMKLKNTEEE